jgi:hypothetical protein
MNINEKVAERLTSVAPVVEDRIVDLLAEKEISRRVEIITQGLARLEEMDKQSRRFERPDVETFTADGAAAPAVFSKARFEEKNKHADGIAKLTASIDKALDGDTSELAKILQQKGGKGGDKGDDE